MRHLINKNWRTIKTYDYKHDVKWKRRQTRQHVENADESTLEGRKRHEQLELCVGTRAVRLAVRHRRCRCGQRRRSRVAPTAAARQVFGLVFRCLSTTRISQLEMAAFCSLPLAAAGCSLCERRAESWRCACVRAFACKRLTTRDATNWAGRRVLVFYIFRTRDRLSRSSTDAYERGAR